MPKLSKEEKKALKAAKKAEKKAKKEAKKRKLDEARTDDTSDSDSEPVTESPAKRSKKNADSAKTEEAESDFLAADEGSDAEVEAEAETVEDTKTPVAKPSSTGTKRTGTCLWFNVQKGFGFVKDSEDDKEYFVHQTSLYCDGFKSLREGETVEFEVEQRNGRECCANVTGPGGAYCIGAEKPSFDGGFGGRGGRGGRGRGRGGRGRGGFRGGRGGRGGFRGGRGRGGRGRGGRGRGRGRGGRGGGFRRSY